MSFSAERFEHFRTRLGARLGAPCRILPVTGSTNDDALAAARAGAPDGTTVVAECQTAGRGRRGRRWHGEPGASLLFSVVLRRNLPLEIAPALALASGLAVRAAIARSLPADSDVPRVKWPNDVWIDRRKVAGVLAESQIAGGTLHASVVGIGINVGSTEFPPELEDVATSIAAAGGRAEREELLALVLYELDTTVAALESHGLAALHADLERYDALAGRPVRIDAVTGIASGIDHDGRLRVALFGGETRAFSAGTVELIA